MPWRKLLRAIPQLCQEINRAEATPQDVVDALHRAVYPTVNVMAAWQTPVPKSDWQGYRENKTLFFHATTPKKFWPEYCKLIAVHKSSATQQMAWRNEGPFTFTEAMRETRASGGDRWIFDLLTKHGMRDGLYCPCGRWMIVFWSDKVFSLTPILRGILSCAASMSACRLQQLVGKCATGQPAFTAREQAILRLLSLGKSSEEIGAHLGISVSSAKTYLRRAQKKLGTKGQVHAVAEAMRRYVVNTGLTLVAMEIVIADLVAKLFP